jgi:hypothetical protein
MSRTALCEAVREHSPSVSLGAGRTARFEPSGWSLLVELVEQLLDLSQTQAAVGLPVRLLRRVQPELSELKLAPGEVVFRAV